MTAPETTTVVEASAEATALVDAHDALNEHRRAWEGASQKRHELADRETAVRASAAALVARVAQHRGTTHADGLIADVRALADQLAPKLEQLAEYLAGLEVDVPDADGSYRPLPDEMRPTVDDLFPALVAVVLQRGEVAA